MENPEVTPLHTPRTPAQKRARRPARLARKRLREEAWRNSFKGLEVIYTNNARFEKFVMSYKRMTKMDGGGRSFKFVRGTTRSHAVTRGSRREGTMKYNLTTEDTEITEDTDRRWHSLSEWSG